MANEQSTCQSERKIIYEPKHHGRNEYEEETPIPMESQMESTIANICYELLERIFDFLDLNSLLNVADTCKRLQIASAAKFGDKFGTKKIGLRSGCHSPGVHFICDTIVVIGLKYCFRFLRCFGAKILHLQDPLFIENDDFLWYFNQFCPHASTSFNFYNYAVFSNRSTLNPFKNVEKVSIANVNLKDILPTFVNLFPNLRYLNLGDLPTRNVYFERDRTTKCALNFLRANRQLKSLEIAPFRKIGIWANVCPIQLDELVDAHPMIEELYLSDCKFDSYALLKFIEQQQKLKLFEFQLKFYKERDFFLVQLNGKWEHKIKSRYEVENKGKRLWPLEKPNRLGEPQRTLRKKTDFIRITLRS